MKTIFLWPLISFHSCFELIHELIHGSGWDFFFFPPRNLKAAPKFQIMVWLQLLWSGLLLLFTFPLLFTIRMQAKQQEKGTKLSAQESGSVILEEQMSFVEEQIVSVPDWECFYSVWNWILCQNVLHVFMQAYFMALIVYKYNWDCEYF